MDQGSEGGVVRSVEFGRRDNLDCEHWAQGNRDPPRSCCGVYKKDNSLCEVVFIDSNG